MTDEQRAERLHWHMYESCEGIREHAERIVALEELVEDMVDAGAFAPGAYCADTTDLNRRAEELGLEVSV